MKFTVGYITKSIYQGLGLKHTLLAIGVLTPGDCPYLNTRNLICQ